MTLKNKDIRLTAKKAGIKLWQIAEALNIPDYTLSRKLRYEFDPEEKEKIIKIINKLSE